MKLTITSLLSFLFFLSLANHITDKHTEKAIDLCSNNGDLCINTKTGEIKSTLELQTTRVTFEEKGHRIDCSVRSGKIEFDGICTKSYVANLILSGGYKNINVFAPELGVVGLRVEPMLSFFVRAGILWADAQFIFILTFLSGFLTAVFGLFRR